MTAQPSVEILRGIDELAASLGYSDADVGPQDPPTSKTALVAALEESRDIVDALLVAAPASDAQSAEIAASVAQNSQQIAELTEKLDALLTLHGLNDGGDDD